MNTANILGRLTRDPEVRHSSGGMPIVNFSVAVNHGKEKVSFFDVKAFGERFEKLAPYLEKGKQVGISGDLEQERWETDGQKRSKVIIVMRNLTFVSEGQADGAERTQAPRDEDVPSDKFEPVQRQAPTAEDDDIPF